MTFENSRGEIGANSMPCGCYNIHSPPITFYHWKVGTARIDNSILYACSFPNCKCQFVEINNKFYKWKSMIKHWHTTYSDQACFENI